MHLAVLARACQEEALIVSDSDGIDWVAVLIQSGHEQALWPDSDLLSLRLSSKLSLVLVAKDEALFLVF